MNQMETLESPLSNLQLELLKAFSHQLDEKDLVELRGMLALFFAKKAIESANEVWDKEGWDEKMINEMFKRKL
jgi:hypothetical protein